MIQPVFDVAAAVFATALVMLLPGTALLLAMGVHRVLDPLLRPAAAVGCTVALASVALVVTLVAEWSIFAFGALLGLATMASAVVALLRWSSPPVGERRRLRTLGLAGASWVPPAAVLVVLGIFDAPHVRSDTYWHVALARKLGELEHLSSSAIAFEAGSLGNANYPLPSWHALVALAGELPRVDLWSATWFLTLWMGPVAMLAFAGMARSLLGDRRAGTCAAWGFVAVVVLGYGPWFFATRYLSYAGQVAIYLLLPVAVTALVAATAARRSGERVAHLALAGGATAVIGVLHGNYVLYPVLFAGGGAVLLLLGTRGRWAGATVGFGVVLVTGMATLAAQLPWITRDDNFLRGSADPSGEPSAFIRHRDVLTGSEESHHVLLGSLAAQPMLVVGALALVPVLVLLRRRTGPWHLVGGALAVAVFARTPWAIELVDRLGSVTPATRFDRVYPAAVGVVAVALAIAWLLERAWHRRGPAIGAASTALALAGVAACTWWADSIRDTARIQVTAFVEARWVGGLDPTGVPNVAVWVASVGTIVAAVAIRMLDRHGAPRRAGDQAGRAREPLLAALVMVAIVAGLAPASIDRAEATWQPEAYRSSLRDDRDVTRIEVYPPAARAAVAALEQGSTVLAAFDDTRRIASLAPVHSVEESVLRELVADPPRDGGDAARTLELLVDRHDADYVAASTTSAMSSAPSVLSFRPLLAAAEADPERYEPITSGALRMFRVRRGDDSGG